MAEQLPMLAAGWIEWSTDADKSEDGWPADYPSWESLMCAARGAMVREHLSEPEYQSLELCWAISEESEELARYVEDHMEECWDVLMRLATSPRSEVRWQVYSVLGLAGAKGETVLRAGLEDPDLYARRRAILSLARLRPPDAMQLFEELSRDSDPYIRMAARELRDASSSEAFP